MSATIPTPAAASNVRTTTEAIARDVPEPDTFTIFEVVDRDSGDFVQRFTEESKAYAYIGGYSHGRVVARQAVCVPDQPQFFHTFKILRDGAFDDRFLTEKLAKHGANVTNRIHDRQICRVVTEQVVVVSSGQ